MPAQTVLNADDPQLTTRDVKAVQVKPEEFETGALRDIYQGQMIRLLSDVSAGQQITNYSVARAVTP